MKEKLITAIIAEISDEIERLKSSDNKEEIIAIIRDILIKSTDIEQELKNQKLREEIISLLRVKGKVRYSEIGEYLIEKKLITEKDNQLMTQLRVLVNKNVVNNIFTYQSNGGVSVPLSIEVFLKEQE